MMRVLTLAVFIFITFINSYGQPVFRNEIVLKKIGITNLRSTGKLNYYRFWWGCRIVEVWQNRDSSIGGQIICFGSESNDDTKNQGFRKKYHSSTCKLNKLKAAEAYKYIQGSNILNIKDGDSITGWNKGWADSYFYIIEVSNRKQYSSRQYINPSGQHSSIMEAKLVDVFYKNLFELVEVKLCWDRFIDDLPEGKEYSFGNYGIEKRRK